MNLPTIITFLRKSGTAMAILMAVPAFCVSAQTIVRVGAGSVASAPPTYKAKTTPGGPGFNATAMLSRKLYIDEEAARHDGMFEVPGRPIPTNDWWTDIINNEFSGALWSYPAMLHTSEEGVEVNYPSYWADMGKEIKSRSSVTVGGYRFRASATIAKDWHDWDVVLRMPSTKGDGEMQVTSVHGSPFTWFEYTGAVMPEVRFSGSAEIFGIGKGMTGVRIGTDLYGIYYPADCEPEINADGLRFDEGTSWVVAGLLRSEKELTDLGRYATSVPRDTKVNWAYDEHNATVATNWEVSAENLRDSNASAPVLQGFLPHVYKYALPGAQLSFIDDKGYMTPRGTMKAATSESGNFSHSYRFSGMLPSYAAPAEGDGFRKEVLDRLMADYATRGSFGGDTYWGGKGLVQMALNMTFAKETGNTEVYEQSLSRLRDAFVNWLTYTPGEDTHFFSYYPRWGAMLGFDVSYDSDSFNDHHFHYGYFTYAAALLCMEDREFASQYGELLTMIAKDYANWDRSDSRFPFMRTLDPWNGHSWAGGLGDHGNDNGNGQESTSEAMQGWGGIYLLGVALGNREMRDAGIWGWNTEARATREYWYDVDAPRSANAGGRQPWAGKGDRKGNYNYDEYPYAYNSNITGKGIGWWTWFGGDPLFMHGTQWMPISPALDYLSWDTDFVEWAFNDMMSGANSSFSHKWFEPTTNSDNGETIEPLAANDWGNVALAYLQRTDPVEAARIFDEALSRGMHIATSVSTSHISYFVTHSHLTYGDPDFGIHADIPTAQVCVRKDGTRTYMVYNPDAADRTVSFYNASGALVRRVTAPAGKLAAISADPVATEIAYTLEGGSIVPPGGEARLTAKVLDQYGAGMSGEAVEVALASGSQADYSGGVLKIRSGAVRGTTFDVTLSCGSVAATLTVTVNERPVTASASIAGVPEICERGMAFEPVFSVTDQYGMTTSPADVKWTLEDRDGNVRSVQSPLNISEAGLYTLRAVSAAGECSTDLFVAPGLPVVSRGAKVAASSAENVGSMPEGAVDGDNNVRWGSAHTENEWLTVDLGETCYLSHVSILWEAAYAARYAVQLAPADAKMTTLDVTYAGQRRKVTVPEESAWVTVTEESATSVGLKDTPVNASGRYLRIRGIERGSAYGYSLYELSAYGVRESMPANSVLGVAFGLPEVMDRDETVVLMPHAYTRGGDVMNDVAVEWSSDKDSDFDGNSFTPRSHGLYTVRATLHEIGTSEATVFVNDVERIGAISLERENYTVIGGDDIEIPFVVMSQFLAPYTGETGEIAVSISDESGAPAMGVSYDAATMTFRSASAARNGKYTLDFGGFASCIVEVRPLNEVNLALGKEASASSTRGDNRASFAVDGNDDTRWESEWADGQTLGVDLGDVYMIDRANILWEGAYARDYRLQTSFDGEEWYDFYAEANGKGGREALSFGPIASRYVRLACDVRANAAYGFSVKELEVYGVSRLGSDAAADKPEIVSFDYATGNGSLNVSARANHASGAVFMTIKVEDEGGNEVSVQRFATPSGALCEAAFDGLATGVYSLTLTVSDAFGNIAEQRFDNVAVPYSIVGINLALGKDARASSSENAALGARYAVDGDLSTRWGSLFNDDEWIIVDLGEAYDLCTIKIHWNNPAFATHYSVALSATGDENDFHTVAERSDRQTASEPDNFNVEGNDPARYVKVTGHRRATIYGTSIDELEVYGKDRIPAAAEAVPVDTDGAERWYGLDGRRLTKTPTEPGVYIRIIGAKAEKTVVR